MEQLISLIHENFLLGMGAKALMGFVNTWQHNNLEAEKVRAMSHKEDLRAHVDLAKIQATDKTGKIIRATVFIMLTATWCGIVLMCFENIDLKAIIPTTVKHGFISRFFTRPDVVGVELNFSAYVIFLFSDMMQVILGSFVIPSRHR